jgi:hypothetical protein
LRDRFFERVHACVHTASGSRPYNPDEADDEHQYASSKRATKTVAGQRNRIDSATNGAEPHGVKERSNNAAAEHACEGISRHAEALFLE